ncbi:hypothetical protein EBT25_03350, partial [bacterium]|nr:hypothetical protein [bacterium]
MAKTIGALSVNMGIKIADFVAGMKTAQTKVVDFSTNVTASTMKVSSAIKGLVALTSTSLAAYGVYKFYDRAIETFVKTEEVMTKIRGLSDNLGADKIGAVMETIAANGRIALEVTGDLAAKFLAAGINSEQTAQMIQSFGSTAQSAGKSAADVFGKLGEIALAIRNTGEVNAQSFAELAALGLPVYDALAKRLSEVTGEAISAERAMEMLTSGQVSGTNALNALLGLQGNDKVKAQAEAQANSLSGIYARLSGEIEGFFSTMGGAIAEALDLKGFNQGFIDFIESLKTNFETGLKPAIENIGIALAAVRDVLFAAFRGLVDFFTRFDESDGMVGSKVNNIRAIVVQFAQGLMGVLQQMLDLAAVAIEKLANFAGGADLAAKFAKGMAGGAAAGAAVGSFLPGIGTGIGALVGAGAGALGVSMSNERFGESADFSGFRAQMEKMFQGISETIGQVGNESAANYLEGFISGLKNSFENKKDNLEKALSIDMKTFFVGLQSGVVSGEIGYSAFLNQLSNGTASAIAVFKREMELGNLSVEQFDETISELESRTLKVLDIALKEGRITNEEYAASIDSLYAKLNSLKPPADVFAPTVPTKLPDWIQQLVDGKSPL